MNKLIPLLGLFNVFCFPSIKNISKPIEKKSYVSILRTSDELGEGSFETVETFSYSSDPTEENHFTKQSVSLNHLGGDMKRVWDYYRGDDVMVAVIDTGMDIYHEDFWENGVCHVSNKSAYIHLDTGNNVVKEGCGDNFENQSILHPDEDYHGTSVAAIAAATITGNGTVGIAPNAKILGIKCQMAVACIAESIIYATDCGADVINMSNGLRGPGQGSIDIYQNAIDYAYSKGVICVASAGNNSTSDPTYPACNEHCIGVGALMQNSESHISNYSNYNIDGRAFNNVDFVAPGHVHTATSYINGVSGYTDPYDSGTSYSAPIVAGAACLYKQKNPSANQDDFYNALLASSRDIGDPGWDVIFGHGALDIPKLLEIDEDISCNPVTTKNQDATCIYWEDQISWNFRTLHMYSLGFYSGYTLKDFENYLTIELGAKSARNGWTFEGTSKTWCYNTENKPGDYLIKTGSSGKEYRLYLPWWVTNAVYQFVNNNNWIPANDPKPYVYDGDGYYKKELKSYIYGSGQVSTPKPSGSCTYDFKAVYVNRIEITTAGDILSNRQEKTCVYDYYHLGSYTAPEGYSFAGNFTDANFYTPYRDSIVRNTITIYTLLGVLNGKFYFQDYFKATKMYAYEYYFVNDVIIEPLGTWPGREMKFIPDLLYKGEGVWFVETEHSDSGRIVFNDGLYQKSSNFIPKKDYYAFRTTSWNYGASNIPGIELAWDIVKAKNEVAPTGNIKEASICGLSTTQINDFIARYNKLSTDVRAVFDEACIYTYNTTDGSYDDLVRLDKVMLQFQKMASETPSKVNSLKQSELTAPLVVIILIMSFTALAIVQVYIRNRRKNNQ